MRALKTCTLTDEIVPGTFFPWLLAGIGDEEIAAIRLHLKQGRAWGDLRFQAMVEKTLGQVAATRPSGRPPRSRVVED
jgi:hypothetical protein